MLSYWFWGRSEDSGLLEAILGRHGRGGYGMGSVGTAKEWCGRGI